MNRCPALSIAWGPWRPAIGTRVVTVAASVALLLAEGFGASPATKGEAERLNGAALARQYCATCHLFPEPETLTKTAWSHHVQPEMARWMGLEKFDYEGTPDGKLLLEAQVYPTSPMLSEPEWFAIWDYYRQAAPSRPAPPPARPAPASVLKQFRVRRINPHQGAPMTSLVKIDAPRRRLYVGDAITGRLFTLDPRGEVLATTRLPSGPVSMAVRDSGLYLTVIGRMFPSDALEGSVLRWDRDATAAEPQPLLQGLRRPTDAVVARLNSDRREDLVVCSFGNRLGRFSWFAAREDGGYEEHILLEQPGAIRAEVRDFNGDARPDVLVMMGQAREALHLFLNQGEDRFTLKTILEKPPSWGLAGFELADFNQDGRLDLVVANGDNGDLALPLKNYHGIRIYLNDGQENFREAFFYQLHGAYKAVARDFDQDGDLDLAAIAYYPDFEREQPESFVYLENTGDLKFSGATSVEGNAGRWMVMDAGDLDGDGDEDVALGSFVRGPTTLPVPLALRERWRREGATVLLLENLAVP